MGIEAIWQSNGGEEIERVPDELMVLSGFANTPPCDISRTKCLQFIDPYGETLFNQRQIPILANELERAAASIYDTSISGHLISVARLVGRAKKINTYVRFVGG